MNVLSNPTYDSIAAALRSGDWHAALELARARLTKDPFDQRALFYFIPAAVSSGIREDVGRLVDFDRLLRRRTLKKIDGYASADEYHSALIRALKRQASPDAKPCRTVQLSDMGELLSRPLETTRAFT